MKVTGMKSSDTPDEENDVKNDGKNDGKKKTKSDQGE